jgi:uncharacterized protein (DUF1499 family)
MVTDKLTLVTSALAAASLLVAALAGVGHRFGWWHFYTGFVLFIGAAIAGVIAIAITLFGMMRGGSVVPFFPTRAAILLCASPAAVLFAFWYWQTRSVPPIHDITTDTQNPPAFQAVLAFRAGAPNPSKYGGAEIAAQQRRAYPDIKSLRLSNSTARAFAAAQAAVQDMGWEIVAADETAGRIEATDTTFWFGFKDDVVVRIVPSNGGSLIDVRSVSRAGRSDVGTNAKRIRTFLERLSDHSKKP